MKNKLKFQYLVREVNKMSEEELTECATLFSTAYGRYSMNSTRKPGNQITMSPAFFEKRYNRKDAYVAMCRYRKRLVGQAIYIRYKIKDKGTMTWVMQLVVNSRYRNQGIGSDLLHAIWGFSDDFAWGLATTNPCTVKALERATFRRCNPTVIKDNLEYIKQLAKIIDFVPSDEYVVDDNTSMANTDFFVDNHEFINEASMKDWKLGNLEPGYEWLAFTFREQEVDKDLFLKCAEEMQTFSEQQLKNAYSRMNMSNHPWASHHNEEISQIFDMIPLKPKSALDLGCGEGRHSIALAKLGIDVIGVDFSGKNIKRANSKKKNLPVKFHTKDIREYSTERKVDLVLCLYDVIGSFPDIYNNQLILEKVYSSLKKGGYAVISVMNYELTEYLVSRDRVGEITKNPEMLYSLAPCNVMQRDGNVYRPEYMLVDNVTGVVYRKEQFSHDGELPAEYLIRDKRYKKLEIEDMAKKIGFEIISSRYVQAGHFDIPLDATDDKAKEIFLLLRRK